MVIFNSYVKLPEGRRNSKNEDFYARIQRSDPMATRDSRRVDPLDVHGTVCRKIDQWYPKSIGWSSFFLSKKHTFLGYTMVYPISRHTHVLHSYSVFSSGRKMTPWASNMERLLGPHLDWSNHLSSRTLESWFIWGESSQNGRTIQVFVKYDNLPRYMVPIVTIL
jgi:hypothetical protein